MFKDFIEQRNKSMIKAALIYMCDKLKITEEEQKIITYYESKELTNNASGTCAGIYFKDKLERIDIKIITHASVIGMIDVLAHELVHAKQHLRGEFTFEKVNTPIFFGLFTVRLLTKFHKGQNLSKVPYYDRLCEQEAHHLAHILTTGFCKAIADTRAKTDLINNKEELIVYPV